jgi:hypothetical protein
VVAAEYSKAEYQINFTDIKVMAKTIGYKGCLVKETTEIQLHRDNFNRDTRFLLRCSWYPPTNIVKQMTALTEHHKEGPVTSNMNSDDQMTVPHTVCAGTEYQWPYDSAHCCQHALGWERGQLCIQIGYANTTCITPTTLHD